ncbi:MAG TPA: hypothetical protein VGA04_35540 [Streptosporangiaceae bacterium]
MALFVRDAIRVLPFRQPQGAGDSFSSDTLVKTLPHIWKDRFGGFPLSGKTSRNLAIIFA